MEGVGLQYQFDATGRIGRSKALTTEDPEEHKVILEKIP